ncbi:hypothetical protein [Aestuariispira insulae]|uniref:Uncharacterized protein n=1 Tax=Aestuariispira insulae TaxID=1461337 RepID=A0A3D9HSQ8_9PROT|nr:hypothetical protein [Aestuariispira insulae]RED52542.1 hypothetical protein DFP90_102565 [Aestuariispira insulae]
MIRGLSFKIRILLILVSLGSMFPGTGMAEEIRLVGADIKSALENRTALYDDGAKQYFDDRGGTLYVSASGRREQGRWRVDGDEYCSHWGRGWDCYEMTGSGDRVSWRASFGKEYKAEMVAGNRL